MAIPQKSTPEIRVRCRGKSSIPRGGTGGFATGVILGSQVGTGGGTSSGPLSSIQNVNPMLSRAWFDGGNLARVGERLEFVRFNKTDSTVEFGASAQSGGGDDEFSGFALRTIESPLDARGTGDSANASKAAGVAEVIWTAVEGLWRGVEAGLEGAARALVNVGDHGQGKVRTQVWPANQGLRWIVTAGSLATTAQKGPVPHVLLTWGDELYGLILPDRQAPRLLRKVNGEWQTILTCKGLLANLRGGRHMVRVRRLAGRGIVEIDGLAWYWVEMAPRAAAANASARRDLVEVRWPEGRAGFQQFGARARVELAAIQYDGGGDQSTREAVVRLGALNFPHQGATAQGSASGWAGNGTLMPVTTRDLGNAAEIVVQLGASPDSLDSPVVNKVSGLFPGTPYSAGSGDYLDISAAVTSATLDMAAPPAQPNPSLSVQIDRMELARIGKEAGVEWGQFVGYDCTIELEARWRYKNGDVGPWTKFFHGFILEPNTATPGVNQHLMTLNCSGPLCRLKDYVVDHRHPPLDVFWMEKLRRGSSGTNTSNVPSPYNPNGVFLTAPTQNPTRLIYTGGEGVCDILWLFVGPEAGRLYVDMPDFTVPLFSAEADSFGYVLLEQLASGRGSAPGTQGWLLSSPQLQPALTWIEQIAAKEQAMFFYGYKAGDDYSDWPRPIYTTLDRLLLNRREHRVVDTVFNINGQMIAPDDVNRVMESIERETRHAARINRVLCVGGNLYGDAMDGLMPSTRMAEARLPADDLNSEANGWERTKILRDDIGAFPGGIEALATGVIDQLTGIGYPNWPVAQLPQGRCYDSARGDYPIDTGDIVFFEMCGPESDVGFGLSARGYRVERVKHVWTMGQNATHSSSISVRPRLSSGT